MVRKVTNKPKQVNNSKCLSKSILWEQMHKYYEQAGPNAWQEEIVPYQITSNKMLAHLYVSLITAAINDYYAANQSSTAKNTRKSQEPFYILELGAGHGKFSFYICKLLAELGLYEKFNILYIASDISEQNINSWQNHPALQPHINNQQLDFAKFNASSDQEINLINSKTTISQQSLTKPFFVIANYLFDTLSHDGFKCEKSKLYATRIDLDANNSKKFSFENFKYKYSHELINSNYYGHDVFDKILAEYNKQLPNGSFLIPIGALQCIENIKLFSKENAIFLVADKGNISLDDFTDIEDPNIAVHGSISFMVNFHALKTFFDLTNGVSMISPNAYTDLQVGCFMASNKSYNLLELIAKQVLYDVNPQNLINLCYHNEKIASWYNIEQVLSMLIISKWDPDLFYDLSDQLISFIEKLIKKEELNLEQDQAIIQGLELVDKYFFKLEKNQDVPFVIGNIYYALEEFDLALKFFHLSIQEFGETVEAVHNIALCYYAEDEFKLAQKYAQQALKVNSKYLAAKKLLAELADMV
jgi:tetratricopeptide (TPR) repeat protein